MVVIIGATPPIIITVFEEVELNRPGAAYTPILIVMIKMKPRKVVVSPPLKDMLISTSDG